MKKIIIMALVLSGFVGSVSAARKDGQIRQQRDAQRIQQKGQTSYPMCCKCLSFVSSSIAPGFKDFKLRCNKNCDSSIFDSKNSLDTFHKGFRRQ